MFKRTTRTILATTALAAGFLGSASLAQAATDTPPGPSVQATDFPPGPGVQAASDLPPGPNAQGVIIDF